jgi:precorrin-6Y C5,15-methyltransferase (decarboxylating)
MSEILIFGVSGEQLTADCLQCLQICCAVVVSKRFEPLLAASSVCRIPIAPVKKMVTAVAGALDTGDVAILASGDPLFFGIGRTMIDRFGADRVRIFPALSAVQLACARFKLSWDDLTLLSLHGRDPGNLAGRILSHSKVMLFTDHQNSPDQVALQLLRVLGEYGDLKRIQKIRVRIADNLGVGDEKITSGSLVEIAAAQFGWLYMMLIEQDLEEPTRPIFGLQENEITHSRGLITKDEGRAVVLHCLRLPRQGVFWDVGGGSGSISVAAAGLSQDLDVFTVEKKDEGQKNIRNNIVRFNLYNIHLIAGSAPEQLFDLPDPDRIFIGGSGGRLADIIDHSADRLPAKGRLVVSAVLTKTAEQAPKLMAGKGLDVDLRTIAVTRHAGQGQPERVLNPITIITGRK